MSKPPEFPADSVVLPPSVKRRRALKVIGGTEEAAKLADLIRRQIASRCGQVPGSEFVITTGQQDLYVCAMTERGSWQVILVGQGYPSLIISAEQTLYGLLTDEFSSDDFIAQVAGILRDGVVCPRLRHMYGVVDGTKNGLVTEIFYNTFSAQGGNSVFGSSRFVLPGYTGSWRLLFTDYREFAERFWRLYDEGVVVDIDACIREKTRNLRFIGGGGQLPRLELVAGWSGSVRLAQWYDFWHGIDPEPNGTLTQRYISNLGPSPLCVSLMSGV